MELRFILFFVFMLIGAGISTLLYKREYFVINVPRLFALWIILTLGGFWIIFYSTNTIQEAYPKKDWPVVTGKVQSAEIKGDRAVRPEVKYNYSVSNIEYTGSTDMKMPAFGGRLNKMDAAEKIAAQFIAGKDITVYYDPADPGVSQLTTAVPATSFIQLASGLIFYTIGISFVILSMLYRKSIVKVEEEI